MKKVVFKGYNVAGDENEPGARNFPTWVVQSFFGDLGYQGGYHDGSSRIKQLLDLWLQGYPHDVVKQVVQTWLMNAIRSVSWYDVEYALTHDAQFANQPDELTYATYKVFIESKTINDVIYLNKSKMDILEQFLLTWLDSRSLRSKPGALNTYAQTVAKIYLDAVQWDKVDSFLRGE